MKAPTYFQSILIILPVVAICQTVEQRSLARMSGELSHLEVCQRVPSIFVAANRSDEGLERYRCLLADRIIFGKRVRVWEIRVGTSVRLSFHANSGQLLAYHDLERTMARAKNQGRTKAMIVESENQAQLKLRALATTIGIPNTWNISTVKVVRDAEDPVDKCSYVGTTFKNSEGVVLATLAIDGQDGRLLSFSRKP